MSSRHANKLKRRDRRRELQVCACLLVLFGGLFCSGLAWTAMQEPRAAAAGNSERAGQGEAQLRSGAILFVPTRGNVCGRRMIDNGTGHTRGASEVVCDEAVSWNATMQGQSQHSFDTRVGALRAGFRARFQ
jgi:hypothetical protein